MDEIDWDALVFPWKRKIDQTPTGNFTKENNARVNKINDRVVIGSDFDCSFSGANGMTPLAYGLHGWAPRDAQLFVDSTVGALSIVGHAQSSLVNEAWPAYPAYIQSAIGVSGFVINDLPNGGGWAGYFDAVRMQGAGFTPTMEICNANFGNVHDINPFNHLSGVSNSPVLWVAVGNGLDMASGSLAPLGLSWKDLNHSDAYAVFLSNVASPYAGTPVVWGNSHYWPVDSLCIDPATYVTYRATVGHTSPAGGSMTQDRAANPSRWKQLPGARKGLVFTAGSIAEVSPGTNVFPVLDMPERHQITWSRKNWATNAVEQSAVIWCENIPYGKPTIVVTFNQYGVALANSNILVDAGKALLVGGKKVVGDQQPFVASPAAEVWALKYAVDQMRQLLISHGLMAPN